MTAQEDGPTGAEEKNTNRALYEFYMIWQFQIDAYAFSK